MVLNFVYTLKSSGSFKKKKYWFPNQKQKNKKTPWISSVYVHVLGMGSRENFVCFVIFKVILMCTYRQKLLPQIVSLMKNRTISVSCCLQNKGTQKFMVNK